MNSRLADICDTSDIRNRYRTEWARPALHVPGKDMPSHEERIFVRAPLFSSQPNVPTMRRGACGTETR